MTTTMRVYETLKTRLAELGWLKGDDRSATPDEALSRAVIAFKVACGFAARDYVGPLTLARLFDAGAPHADTATGEPPWMTEVRKHLGMNEDDDRTALAEWLHSDGSSIGDPSRTPWCADCIQTAIRLTLPDERLPENPFLAFNWLKMGRTLKAPAPGAILVFHRGNPSSVYGHLALYAGETDTHFIILGGNQNDSISISRLPRSRLRPNGIRWPRTARPPENYTLIGHEGDIDSDSRVT